MARSQSTLIEFFGPPGVGKSTVANKLYKTLNKQDINTTSKTQKNSDIKNRFYRNISKFRYIMLDGDLSFENWRKSYKIINKDISKRDLRFWNLLLYVQYLKSVGNLLNEHPGIHILDQGIFQFCWSLSYTKNDSFDLPEIIRQFPIFDNHIIIFISADADIIYRRLTSRGTNRSKVENNKLTESKIKSIQEEFTSIYTLASDKKTITNIRIDNSGQIKYTINKIIDHLNKENII